MQRRYESAERQLRGLELKYGALLAPKQAEGAAQDVKKATHWMPR